MVGKTFGRTAIATDQMQSCVAETDPQVLAQCQLLRAFHNNKKVSKSFGCGHCPQLLSLFPQSVSFTHTILTFLPDSGVQLFLHGQQTANDILLPGRKTNGLCEAVCVYAHRSKGSRHIGPTFPLVGHTRTSVPVCVLRRCQPKKRKISFFFFSSLRPAGESCDVPVYLNNFRAKKDKAFPVRALVIHQITRMAQPKKIKKNKTGVFSSE